MSYSQMQLDERSKGYVYYPVIVPEDQFLEDDKEEVVDMEVSVSDQKLAKPVDRERVQTKIPQWRVFNISGVPEPDETTHQAELQNRFHIQAILNKIV